MVQDPNIYLKQTKKTFFIMFHNLSFTQVLLWKYGRSLTNKKYTKIQIDQGTFDHVQVRPTPFFGIVQFVTQFTHVLRNPKALSRKQ